jgi:hypothetical protein
MAQRNDENDAVKLKNKEKRRELAKAHDESEASAENSHTELMDDLENEDADRDQKTVEAGAQVADWNQKTAEASAQLAACEKLLQDAKDELAVSLAEQGAQRSRAPEEYAERRKVLERTLQEDLKSDRLTNGISFREQE